MTSLICACVLLGPTLGEVPMVRVQDYGPCGKACLYLACQIIDERVSWDALSKLLDPVERNGTHTLEQLRNAAESLGFHAVAIKGSVAELGRLPCPFLAHVRAADGAPIHYILVKQVGHDHLVAMDPPRPAGLISLKDFESFWTGYALVINAESLPPSGRSRPVAVAVGLLIAGVFAAVAGWSRRVVSFRLSLLGRTVRIACCIVAGAFVLGGVASLLRSWIRPAAPRLEVEKALVDFGELPLGQSVQVVRIRNAGTAKLDLADATSSCTCASVSPSGSLAPQEESELRLQLTVAPGSRSAQIRVFSNDPEGPRDFTVRFSGGSRPLALPPRVAGNAKMGAAFERMIRLAYPSSGSLELTSCDCKSPAVQVEPVGWQSEAIDLPSTYPRRKLGALELRVRVNSPSVPGRFESLCRMSLRSGEGTHYLTVPLSVDFETPIACEPRVIAFSAPTSEGVEGQARRIRVVSHSIEPIGNIAVSNVPDWLKCEVVKEGAETKLGVVVSRRPPGPFVRHTLHVSNGDQRCELEIIASGGK